MNRGKSKELRREAEWFRLMSKWPKEYERPLYKMLKEIHKGKISLVQAHERFKERVKNVQI